jgi:DNA-binding NarL/FixJ family response regulator
MFVDDEPALLDGLRRMLRAGRGERRMTFVPSAEAALTLLRAEPVDVVVTDMMMPGMDGATLLEEIRARWPQTVRIVLSGYSSQSASLRSSSVAHQYLSKPCDSATLTAALRAACDLTERLARPELRRLLGGIDALPSAPRSFLAINAALAEPDACAAARSSSGAGRTTWPRMCR